MLIGKVLGKRYEIISKIGEGGMSVVYKAHCNVLNRTVAVKVLKEQYSHDEAFIIKFKNEALSVARLNSGYIINVYDVGKEDDIVYIVMEYVDGENLKEILRIQGKFSEKDTLVIAKQIAFALEEAHNKKIIHRDIKTQNIMMTSSGIIKVADFGIAKAVSGTTIVNNSDIMGSAHYMSPEQGRGGYVDNKTDLYSLGIVMYELVTGRLPYNGETPASIFAQHANGKVAFRSTDRVSSSLKEVIYKLTQKNPDMRYRNARELIESIEYIQNGESLPRERDNFLTSTVNIPSYVPSGIRDKYDYNYNVEEKYTSREPVEESTEYSENYEKEKKTERKHTGSKFLKTLLVFCLGVIIFSVAGILLTLNPPDIEFFGGGKIVVPDLKNKTEEEARTLCEENNLSFQVSGSEVNNKYEPGTITSQNPISGSKVSKGDTISVTVSEKVVDIVVIPNFMDLGLKKDEIVTRFSDAFKFEFNYVDSTKENDTVLKQMPEAGGQVEKGTLITLFLSRKSEEAPVEVPDVTSKKPEEAKTLLSSFTVSESYKEDKTKEEGIILSQNPVAGTMQKSGSTVSIVINKYETPKEVTSRLIITLSPEGPDVTLRVSDDATGQDVFNKNIHRADYENGVVAINVKGMEGTEKKYTAYLDDVYYTEAIITFDSEQ